MYNTALVGCSQSLTKPQLCQIGAFLSRSCNFSPVTYSRDQLLCRSDHLCRRKRILCQQNQTSWSAEQKAVSAETQPVPGEIGKTQQNGPAQAAPSSPCCASTSPARFNVTVTLHSTLHPISFGADKDCFCFISIGLLMAYSLLSRCIFIR